MWLYFPLPTVASEIFRYCHVVFVDKTSGVPWYRPWPPPKSLSTRRWVGRDTVVCIATCYGLDGPRIESRTCRDRPWGPPSLLYNRHRVSFPWGEAAEEWRWPPTPSSAKVKERVELCLYSPSGLSWPVTGGTLSSTQISPGQRLWTLFGTKNGLYGIWTQIINITYE